MDIHKLKAFIDLTQTLSYTETAEHLFTTQGNISKQILAVEKELGVELFYRKHRKIQLTEAGKITLPFAQEIVEQFERLQETVNDYKEETNLLLHIYTIPTMPSYHGFEEITNFLKVHPEVKIQLTESESFELFPTPLEGRNHIVFARKFDENPDIWEWLRTEQDQFVAVLSKEHPLAYKKELELTDLAQENFLLLGKETNLYQPVIDLCHQVGFEPEITYEGTRIDLILTMIASRLGITIAMEKSVVNLLNDKVVAIPVTPNRISSLCFVRKKGTNGKASDMFWRYLQKNKKYSILE